MLEIYSRCLILQSGAKEGLVRSRLASAEFQGRDAVSTAPIFFLLVQGGRPRCQAGAKLGCECGTVHICGGGSFTPTRLGRDPRAHWRDLFFPDGKFLRSKPPSAASSRDKSLRAPKFDPRPRESVARYSRPKGFVARNIEILKANPRSRLFFW